MNEDQHKALVEEIVSELTIKISEGVESKITNLIEPRLKSMSKDLEVLQRSVDRIDSDMAGDRKDIGQLKINMGTILGQFEEIQNLFSQQTRVIVSKVSDKVSAGIDEAVDKAVETGAAMVSDTLDDFVANKPKLERKTKGLLNWIKNPFKK